MVLVIHFASIQLTATRMDIYSSISASTTRQGRSSKIGIASSVDVVDWKLWYQWRSLPLESPAALLMHYPLSLCQLQRVTLLVAVCTISEQKLSFSYKSMCKILCPPPQHLNHPIMASQNRRYYCHTSISLGEYSNDIPPRRIGMKFCLLDATT
jgi:hypothetical protein